MSHKGRCSSIWYVKRTPVNPSNFQVYRWPKTGTFPFLPIVSNSVDNCLATNRAQPLNLYAREVSL